MPKMPFARQGNVMLVYAVLFAIIFSCVREFLSQPMGTIIFFLTLAGWMAVAAAVMWKRTRLLFLSLGMGTGALVWMLCAFFAWHGGWALSLGWSVLFITLVVVMIFMRYAESRINSGKFKDIEAAMSDAAFLDIPLFRFIPNLR